MDKTRKDENSKIGTSESVGLASTTGAIACGSAGVFLDPQPSVTTTIMITAGGNVMQLRGTALLQEEIDVIEQP